MTHVKFDLCKKVSFKQGFKICNGTATAIAVSPRPVNIHMLVLTPSL